MNQEIQSLIRKYIVKTISKEELRILNRWVKDNHNSETFKKLIKEYFVENRFDSNLGIDEIIGNLLKENRPIYSKRNKVIPELLKYNSPKK